VLEFIVNADAFASLPADLQAIVESAARYVNQDMLDEYTARNNRALKELVEVHGVKLRRLPDDVIIALKQAAKEAVEELAASDPMAAEAYASFAEFYEGVKNYHSISEQAYINARDLEADPGQ
jgi:TRAP-type mannitol/chloroaromatic compound transport system substrate-binding protein